MNAAYQREIAVLQKELEDAKGRKEMYQKLSNAKPEEKAIILGQADAKTLTRSTGTELYNV